MRKWVGPTSGEPGSDRVFAIVLWDTLQLVDATSSDQLSSSLNAAATSQEATEHSTAKAIK